MRAIGEVTCQGISSCENKISRHCCLVLGKKMAKTLALHIVLCLLILVFSLSSCVGVKHTVCFACKARCNKNKENSRELAITQNNNFTAELKQCFGLNCTSARIILCHNCRRKLYHYRKTGETCFQVSIVPRNFVQLLCFPSTTRRLCTWNKKICLKQLGFSILCLYTVHKIKDAWKKRTAPLKKEFPPAVSDPEEHKEESTPYGVLKRYANGEVLKEIQHEISQIAQFFIVV